MNYISTRGGIKGVSFCDAVMMGMARDGGLILPDKIPDVSDLILKWKNLSYTDLAFEIFNLYSDIPESDLKNLIRKSYSTFTSLEITPVKSFNGLYILELFHGPTLAFKDVALQFLGNLFEYIMKSSDGCLNVLVATSGDTGSAAIHGLRGKNRIKIFVMHPKGRISEVQKLQMTTVLDDNVSNIAIDGTFDDCQNIMKSIFNDLDFKDNYSLGSVNSINWARLMAQVIYYFYSTFRVMADTGSENVSFAVPTGNFGDIFAGYIAMRMGLPISKLVLATNENNILSRFFDTGSYNIGKVYATISPSMDIQVASNFERYLYYKMKQDSAIVCDLMRSFAEKGCITIEPMQTGKIDNLFVSGYADTGMTLTTIKDFYNKYEYLIDPHTAVGVSVGSRYLSDNVPMICLATAHPAKFSKAIHDAIGRDIAHHPILNGLKDIPTRCDVLPASIDAVRSYIELHIGDR